jgi:hypothetical protein
MYKKSISIILELFIIFVFVSDCSKHLTPIANNISGSASILETLRKVDAYPVYVMEYDGDYGFSDYLQNGEYPQLSKFEPPRRSDNEWGCTCFTAMGNENTRFFGRNFDWNSCIPMVLFTRPPDGYSSVSTVDLEYFGFHRGNLPDEATDKERLLYTPYLPFDGMNEKGVAVGMMAIPAARGPYDASKVTIGEIEIIRLILDYAASTEEALQLIQEYNIQFTNPPIHYMISDRSGTSVIVEFIEGQMHTFTSIDSFQISTNFIIHGSGAPIHTTCWRYNLVYDTLDKKDGILNQEESLLLLGQSSQPNTIWSATYNLNSGEIWLAPGRKYSSPIQFRLPLQK